MLLVPLCSSSNDTFEISRTTTKVFQVKCQLYTYTFHLFPIQWLFLDMLHFSCFCHGIPDMLYSIIIPSPHTSLVAKITMITG